MYFEVHVEQVKDPPLILINVEFLYISVLCVKHNILNIDNLISKKNNKLKMYNQNLWQKYYYKLG